MPSLSRPARREWGAFTNQHTPLWLLFTNLIRSTSIWGRAYLKKQLKDFCKNQTKCIDQRDLSPKQPIHPSFAKLWNLTTNLKKIVETSGEKITFCKCLESSCGLMFFKKKKEEKKGQMSRLVKHCCREKRKTQCSATLLTEHDKPSIGNSSKGSASFKLFSVHNKPVIICKWAG